MSAALTLRCARALPVANSTLSFLRKSSRLAPVNITAVAEREGAMALQLARVVQRHDGSALNMGVLAAHANVFPERPGLRIAIHADAAASLAAVVMPEMEAVNRNARRPKKANHGKRPCSHVGRRRRRRRKVIIRNGPPV